MLMHAMAPHKIAPPELYAKWTYVTELGLDWPSLGGIDYDEISLLAKLVNIQREAEAMKQRTQNKGR